MKKYLIMAGGIILVIIIVITLCLLQPKDKPADSDKAQKNKEPMLAEIISSTHKDQHPNSIASHAKKASVSKIEPIARDLVLEQAVAANVEPDDEHEPAEVEDSMVELEYQRNLMFEEEARETFPLLSVQTSNPTDIEKKVFGPKKGEVWVRIKPENAKEFKEIMAETADLYKDVAEYDDPVTVVLWVGNKVWSKIQYPHQEEPDKSLP